jgi:hypothetical protein
VRGYSPPLGRALGAAIRSREFASASRMREAYDRTRSTEEAVVEGIGRTGRDERCVDPPLSFVAFSAQPGAEGKIFATALGGGILIDATIIRGVLAPAFVAILGRWNWWLPHRPARILRVEPSAAQPEATRSSGGIGNGSGRNSSPGGLRVPRTWACSGIGSCSINANPHSATSQSCGRAVSLCRGVAPTRAGRRPRSGDRRLARCASRRRSPQRDRA